MTIEVATYVNDLQPTNPASTDQVSQGDDHLRLIKQVLQNTFANATRQFQVPGVRSVAATGNLLKSDGNGVVFVNTFSAAVGLTLPSLTTADQGWIVYVMKISSDNNPLFISAPSGNVISGGISVTRARRCVPQKRFCVMWDGTNWYCERINVLPIGSMIDFWGTTIPGGYEWPNGQTLGAATTNYQEYYNTIGTATTPDVRGLTCIPLDNLGGGAAGRLGNIINGTVMGSVGGSETVTLTAGQLPGITSGGSTSGGLSVSVSSTAGNVAQGSNITVNQPGTGSPAAYASLSYGAISSTGSTSGSLTVSTTSNNTGGGYHSNLQPSIMVSKILVVE